MGGTLKCQVCGSANLEELCHEPPHPRFLCLDCNSGLSSDGRPVLAAPDQADQVGDTQRGRVSVSALFFLVCGLLAIALQACLLADAVQRFLGWFA
ncbi:MAG: hypothetical protein BGO79_21595 [Delftia sp. 67-8]|nr:MAG: hypothetical protein BGO79_21595 [Delftia sp. 67-8]